MTVMDLIGQCSVYQVDREGRLTYVNEVWDAFARANEGEHLVGIKILGTVLWEQITEPATRQLYRMVVERAWRKGTVARFPFRCDGPAVIRHMSMRVERVGAECCQFTATIERLEPRPPVALLDPRTRRADAWLRICSWCKKVALPAERWVEIDEALATRELFVEAGAPALTHTICPTCHRERTADLESPPGG